ncbi:daf-12-interacting protein 1-like [Galleria mellonella]|uniref:Daf-12-interacting protein 1-like n=1 Tax=Galleria mellonella TaxID=7137 RepID=A0A6J3CE01_GALME|nr:daf-12-interacting protein 1-like [Galleria mellonella]
MLLLVLLLAGSALALPADLLVPKLPEVIYVAPEGYSDVGLYSNVPVVENDDSKNHEEEEDKAETPNIPEAPTLPVLENTIEDSDKSKESEDHKDDSEHNEEEYKGPEEELEEKKEEEHREEELENENDKMPAPSKLNVFMEPIVKIWSSLPSLPFSFPSLPISFPVSFPNIHLPYLPSIFSQPVVGGNTGAATYRQVYIPVLL